jgi:hypothetical protein
MCHASGGISCASRLRSAGQWPFPPFTRQSPRRIVPPSAPEFWDAQSGAPPRAPLQFVEAGSHEHTFGRRTAGGGRR